MAINPLNRPPDTKPEPTPPPVANPNAPGAPQPKREPDTGHANAADKPFHERLGGGGADPHTPAKTKD